LNQRALKKKKKNKSSHFKLVGSTALAQAGFGFDRFSLRLGAPKLLPSSFLKQVTRFLSSSLALCSSEAMPQGTLPPLLTLYYDGITYIISILLLFFFFFPWVVLNSGFCSG